MVTGHGCLGRYLHRLPRREPAAQSHHCDNRDDEGTTKHTLTCCTASAKQRAALVAVIGQGLSLPTVVTTMLGSDASWKGMLYFSESTISQKKAAEREKKSSSLSTPICRRQTGGCRRLTASDPASYSRTPAAQPGPSFRLEDSVGRASLKCLSAPYLAQVLILRLTLGRKCMGNTMAPLNIVDTPYSDLTKLEDSIENKPNNQANKPNNFEKTNTVDPYDEVKLNEPIFLAPIRKWEKSMGFVTPIRWTNAIFITTFHVVTVVWGFYTLFYEKQKPMWQSVIFGIFMGQLAGFGVTAGAHRYWCHRSYKAKLPLQLILALCYSAAGQNTIYEWVRDHRVHHKFSETSADPHDANRGFFFSHIGWLMMKKHPDVVKQGSKIDMSDIIHDPVVIFCTKYFILFKITFCWVIPSALPVYAWGELWNIAILSQAFWRYMLSLHFTWSVNSFAHLWGNKPYDRYIMPCENKGVSIVAMGEGWHNYHHTFPWDYKAAELGVPNNTTTFLLDLFAKIGWAYDLKQASPALVRAVAKQRGECKE